MLSRDACWKPGSRVKFGAQGIKAWSSRAPVLQQLPSPNSVHEKLSPPLYLLSISLSRPRRDFKDASNRTRTFLCSLWRIYMQLWRQLPMQSWGVQVLSEAEPCRKQSDVLLSIF